MTKIHRFVLILIVLFTVISLQALTQQDRQSQERIRGDLTQRIPDRILSRNKGEETSDTRTYAEDHILVKFSPLLTSQHVQALTNAYGSQASHRIPVVDLYRVQVPEGSTVEEMVEVWNQNSLVEYAKPDYIARVAVTPNDLFFRDQYALSNTGQVVPGSPGGTPSSDISATTAWEETTGASGILIAVIDTGVDLTHPDLVNKMYSSGKDFVNGDDDATDDFWHGTAVAGITAAESNNGIGIAGVAWNCMILPVKCMDKNGEGSYSDVIEGILWATDNGAHVINLSLGGPFDDPDLEEAVRYAFQRGVVVVASSGNESGEVLYPAAYDNYVLAVASTDMDDMHVPESNFGPEIDVAAPGEAILTTVPVWDVPPNYYPYSWTWGTSFAAPHVSGMAALILSAKPWMEVSDVMNVIRYTADDVNADEYPGRDDYLGYGRINLDTGLVPIPIKK
ncbi:MAG: S8 family peptidase [Candidatus Aminicenantaceae bacterium]